MKRILSLVLAFACLCSCAALAASNTARTSIGGKSAETVTIDMHAGVAAEVVLAQGSVNKDQPVSEMLSAASAKGVPIAAVNGGFFNAYYAQGTELDGYGAVARCYASIVRDGMIINGGSEESAVYLGITSDGKALIDEVAVTLYVCCNGKKLPTWGVNSYFPEPSSVLLFTPEAGYDLPVPANARVAKIVGGKVVEMLTSGTMVCTPGTYYFVCGKELHDAYVPAVGDTVSFTTEFSKSEWSSVTTAVSCGPWLLHAGKDAFAENSKYPYLADQKVSETAVAARSFAAVLENGDLMLGACTASPRQIIDYLLSIGATDAMLLDGGASSMLCANGSTLRSAGRRLNNILCFYEGAAVETKTAQESTQTVELDGRKLTMPAYKLVSADGDTNYVRLRDLAQLLNGTAAQFDVTWNGTAGAVNITAHHAYDHPNGTEGGAPFHGPQAYSAFTGSTLINNRTAALDAFVITHDGGGHTYYQLRELGRALNFNVGWSAERGVFIETDKPYTDAN